MSGSKIEVPRDEIGSLIVWEVTVTGQGSECHLTVVIGRHYIAE